MVSPKQINSRVPGLSVQVFIASCPGLSELHVTPKPLICVENSNSTSKTHHLQPESVRRPRGEGGQIDNMANVQTQTPGQQQEPRVKVESGKIIVER